MFVFAFKPNESVDRTALDVVGLPEVLPYPEPRPPPPHFVARGNEKDHMVVFF